ncbi:MAG TPA: MBL fold metallo-hydrolase [Gaiellaceae bacterium]
MRLIVVGSSPAWPNPGSAHAGYLVETPTGRLLVDCGPGVLALLREREGWPRVDAIAITHTHLDHVGDLVPWVWGRLMGPAPDERPPLWLPPGGRDALGELLSSDQLDGCFAVQEYAERAPFEAADATVEPIGVRHYGIPAFGLRVAADGKVVAFSGDTGPTAALDDLARDADCFVCEATLPDGTVDEGHLTAAEAVAVAGRAGARRLLLTHRPVELAAPAGVDVARDGLTIEL